MPAEWAPHERTWMAWPHREELWGDKLAAMQAGYADVINAIAAFEPVTVLAVPEEVDHCHNRVSGNATVLPVDLNDAWMRDIGPNFVLDDQGNLAASIYHFNAWGKKYDQWGRDAAIGHRIAEYLGIRTFSSTIFMEGGGVSVDGEGTLITSEQCVLNPNRNPGLDKDAAELAFRESLGVERVLWCPGDPDDIETDGHIDGIACFVEPGKVLVEVSPAKDTERYDNMQANLQAYEGAIDAKGRKLEVVTIEEAHEAERTNEIYASSYINFYVANDAVIMPAFGIDRDRDARDTIANLFPDREIVQVDIRGIAPGGGGIHCITQQQPRSNLGA
jgi:agmatine deiminase